MLLCAAGFSHRGQLEGNCRACAAYHNFRPVSQVAYWDEAGLGLTIAGYFHAALSGCMGALPYVTLSRAISRLREKLQLR
jgi:hypothetical protein